MFTNERYTQITELTAPPNIGVYGTTKSKDAGPPVYRAKEGLSLFKKGLRRQPGEGGGRPGLETMGWAKGMYIMHYLIGLTQHKTCEGDAFHVYPYPILRITEISESLNKRLYEVLEDPHEYIDIGAHALILLEALTKGMSGYVCRAGMWFEYNATVGDRVYTLGHRNAIIPTTSVLIKKMELIKLQIQLIYEFLDDIVIECMRQCVRTEGSAWQQCKYHWHRMGIRMRMGFKPKCPHTSKLHVDTEDSEVLQWDNTPRLYSDQVRTNSIPKGDADRAFILGIVRNNIALVTETHFHKVARDIQKNRGLPPLSWTRKSEWIRPTTATPASMISNKVMGEQGEGLSSELWMVTQTRVTTSEPLPKVSVYNTEASRRVVIQEE
jgi:hypothetical protein